MEDRQSLALWNRKNWGPTWVGDFQPGRNPIILWMNLAHGTSFVVVRLLKRWPLHLGNSVQLVTEFFPEHPAPERDWKPCHLRSIPTFAVRNSGCHSDFGIPMSKLDTKPNWQNLMVDATFQVHNHVTPYPWLEWSKLAVPSLANFVQTLSEHCQNAT